MNAAPSDTTWDSQPTELESVLSQGANDLKVTGFGQRTRAALRRNRDAGEDTFLPSYENNSITAPDLIRHLNALILHLLGGMRVTHLANRDRDLLLALRDSLIVVTRLVASVWTTSMRQVATSFIDYDDLPGPFCIMYPDTRSQTEDTAPSLPTQTSRIIDRIRTEIERTPIWQLAHERAEAINSSDLEGLRDARASYRTESQYREDETLGEWRDRCYRLIEHRRRHVPMELLLLNRLIHTSISTLVSLAIWDYQITPEEIVESEMLDAYVPEYDASGSQPHGPELPEGFNLSTVPSLDLILMPLDSALRVKHESRLAGIIVVKGASLHWEEGGQMDTALNVVRLSAFESHTNAEMNR